MLVEFYTNIVKNYICLYYNELIVFKVKPIHSIYFLTPVYYYII